MKTLSQFINEEITVQNGTDLLNLVGGETAKTKKINQTTIVSTDKDITKKIHAFVNKHGYTQKIDGSDITYKKGPKDKIVNISVNDSGKYTIVVN